MGCTRLESNRNEDIRKYIYIHYMEELIITDKNCQDTQTELTITILKTPTSLQTKGTKETIKCQRSWKTRVEEEGTIMCFHIW